MTDIKFEQSALERQNVLNNKLAVNAIVESLDIKGFIFEGELKFTRKQVVDYLEIDDSTLVRYLTANSEELLSNGYKVYKGQKLKEIKDLFDLTGIDAGQINPKTPNLGLFNFKAFLNLAMLLKEGDKAREVRSLILNTVIGVLDKNLGNSKQRKFINQKDGTWLDERFMGKIYRTEFTDTLKDMVGGLGSVKYSRYTNKIYEFLFAEKCKEYRTILDLEKADLTRDSFYTEIITIISSFETGLSHEIRRAFNLTRRYLNFKETDDVFTLFFSHPMWKPQIDSVRRKMASRDHVLRGVDHDKLDSYLVPMDVEDFDKFLHDMDLKEVRAEKRAENKLRLAQKTPLISLITEVEFDGVVGVG